MSDAMNYVGKDFTTRDFLKIVLSEFEKVNDKYEKAQSGITADHELLITLRNDVARIGGSIDKFMTGMENRLQEGNRRFAQNDLQMQKLENAIASTALDLREVITRTTSNESTSLFTRITAVEKTLADFYSRMGMFLALFGILVPVILSIVAGAINRWLFP